MINEYGNEYGREEAYIQSKLTDAIGILHSYLIEKGITKETVDRLSKIIPRKDDTMVSEFIQEKTANPETMDILLAIGDSKIKEYDKLKRQLDIIVERKKMELENRKRMLNEKNSAGDQKAYESYKQVVEREQLELNAIQSSIDALGAI